MGRTIETQLSKVKTPRQMKKQYSIHDFQKSEIIGCRNENNRWIRRIHDNIPRELNALLGLFNVPPPPPSDGPAKEF